MCGVSARTSRSAPMVACRSARNVCAWKDRRAARSSYHSFFYTHNPDAFTQLGAALHFYGVKLLYAPALKPKVKSNAATTTGKNASFPSSPPTTSWSWLGPTSSSSTNSFHTPTSKPSPKNDPCPSRPEMPLVAPPLEPANPRPRRGRRQSPRGRSTPFH